MGDAAEGPDEKCEGKDSARRGPGGTARARVGASKGSGRSGMLKYACEFTEGCGEALYG